MVPTPGLIPVAAVEVEAAVLGPELGLGPGPGLRLTAPATGFPWIGVVCRS